MHGEEYESIPSEDSRNGGSEEPIKEPSKRQSFFNALWNGPRVPQKPQVTLWCESVQTWPYRVTKHRPNWFRYMFTLLPFGLWCLIYAVLNSHSLMAEPLIGGQPTQYVGCTAQIPAWEGHNADCGINGTDCLSGYPVGSEFRFKCSANCRKESWTYRPLAVGSEVIYHQPFLVGSDNTYRADSFICAAALHQNVISDSRGGCVIVKLGEFKPKFEGKLGNNSVASIPFDTGFPASFSFESLEGLELRGCDDRRNIMMIVSFWAVVVIGYLSVDPPLFVLAVSLIGAWTVILASNPPWQGGDAQKNAEIISLAVRRLLPMLLAMVPIYQFSLRSALRGCKANLTRAIFWCIPFHLGIVENYTFGMIPIDRLTLNDLNGQAGAWSALFIIAGIALLIVVSQAYIIWRQGKFWPYLTGYISVLLFLALLGRIPSQTLRIHHYILALVFLPGTGFQTTLSFVCNGLCTALFIAGVARWDFDSILQTYDQLRRGGPEQNTGAAVFIDPLIEKTGDLVKSIIIKWRSLDDGNAYRWNGYSLLVNDVEVHRGNDTEFDILKWALEINPTPVINYVRLAVADVFSKKTGSFSMAGVLNITSGEWTAPIEGMT